MSVQSLQNRHFIVAVLPIVVIGGAAAFAYVTWSQVAEKRKIREAAEAEAASAASKGTAPESAVGSEGEKPSSVK